MSDADDFWDFYWETHLQALENLGKREAILAGSQLLRALFRQSGQPVRLLELGCGEGQVVGALLEAHAQLCAGGVVGVDYNAQSLALCRRDFPGWQFIKGDFTDPILLASTGQCDLLLLVNALHEVYSAELCAGLGEADVPAAKQKVEDALAGVVNCLAPGGWLLLFDGLEPPGDPQELVHIRFLERQARDDFETFARQYQPLRIVYHATGEALGVALSRRHFTRYITKSIFLGKPHLWQTERTESYQYFTAEEFCAVFARQGLQITELRTLTVNDEKWRRLVQIDTPGVDFPEEHLLIVAQWIPR